MTFFVKDTHRERLGLQPRENSKKDETFMAEVEAEHFTESDMILIAEVDEFYDEFETDDERSMDYPSTPGNSSEDISPDDTESDDYDDELHGRFLGLSELEYEHNDNRGDRDPSPDAVIHCVRKHLRPENSCD